MSEELKAWVDSAKDTLYDLLRGAGKGGEDADIRWLAEQVMEDLLQRVASGANPKVVAEVMGQAHLLAVAKGKRISRPIFEKLAEVLPLLVRVGLAAAATAIKGGLG